MVEISLWKRPDQAVLPHSIEAEQSVIGSMLMDRVAVSCIGDHHGQRFLLSTTRGIMFDAMVELFNEGKPVDLVTLQDRLKEKDVPPEVNNLDFVRISLPLLLHQPMLNPMLRLSVRKQFCAGL